MIKDEITHLNLTGKNEEDLNIISAYLQDSIATAKDMVFLKKNRTFIMIVNRIYHLDRGYENIEKKLSRCGAQIKRLK